MAASTETPVGFVDAAVHHRVQQFYAEQMQLLDRGEAEPWARTFTEDGVFGTSVDPEPARGRAAIAAGAAEATARLAADGVVHRHWLGMLHLRPAADGGLHARSYALVIRTPKGGEPVVWRSCVCEDLLVPTDGGGWLVRERHVHRDDLS